MAFSKKIESNSFRKYLPNTSWLLIEKVLRVGLGLAVGLWVVRYLGPEDFGILSYAQGIIVIFSVFCTLGLDRIVVQEIIKDRLSVNLILGSAFVLKLSGALIIVLTVITVQFSSDNSEIIRNVIVLLSFTSVFQSLNVIDFYFQSQVKSKYVVYSSILSLTVGSVLRVIFILQGLGVFWFAFALVIESFVLGSALIIYFAKKGFFISMWSPNLKMAKKLLTKSWPLIISSISYLLYTRIDQVMIKEIIDNYSVGIYSAAYRIYELPMFVPLIIASSIFPLIQEKYNEGINELMEMILIISSWMTLMAYLALTLYIVFGDVIIELFFGMEYKQSSEVLLILSFGMIPMFNAFLRSGYLIASGNQKIILVTSLVTALLNVVLNFFMIPVMGINGAALSTVICQFIALIILNLFFKETRIYLRCQIEALFLRGLIKKR